MNPYVYALQDQVFQNFIQRKLKHVYGLLSVSDFDLRAKKDVQNFEFFGCSKRSSTHSQNLSSYTVVLVKARSVDDHKKIETESNAQGPQSKLDPIVETNESRPISHISAQTLTIKNFRYLHKTANLKGYLCVQAIIT